jgi:DNA polymerase epsilon subunit 1
LYSETAWLIYIVIKVTEFHYSEDCIHINFQPETDLFATQSRLQAEQIDIEDIANRPQDHGGTGGRPLITKRKRMPTGTTSSLTQSSTLTQSWRDVLGPPPPLGNTKVCNSLIL